MVVLCTHLCIMLLKIYMVCIQDAAAIADVVTMFTTLCPNILNVNNDNRFTNVFCRILSVLSVPQPHTLAFLCLPLGRYLCTCNNACDGCESHQQIHSDIPHFILDDYCAICWNIQ